jgi:5-methylcytosine-specific restriction endonuclease McrA
VGFTTWDDYIKRMFEGKLQPLCETCHKAKSKIENAERRATKKAKKELLNDQPENAGS